jgi:DNA-nicking Smr family endonuclease
MMAQTCCAVQQGIGMTSKPPSRRRPLSAEEAELWAYAMRDAKTLRRRSVPPNDLQDAGADKPSSAHSPQAPQSKRIEKPAIAAGRTPPKAPQDKPPSSPIARFDERRRRKLARAAETIDARLDLHGMRQREAHSALRGFLFASAARGHRNVLIITGKGTRGELERKRDYFLEERGVLRRLVPQWLGEPEFRAVVLSFASAGVRHGGEGALYVRLRKPRDHTK